MALFTKRYHEPGTLPGTLVEAVCEAPLRITLVEFTDDSFERPLPGAGRGQQVLRRQQPAEEAVQRPALEVGEARHRRGLRQLQFAPRARQHALAQQLQRGALAVGQVDAIALACGSHSSEPDQVALARRMLGAIGCTEADLACGPHTPLSSAVHESALRAGAAMSAAWSNCSGKHGGMLALARHRGWPTAGYERAGHPAQDRILDEVARWTGVPRESLVLGVDGCTTVCFGLPLRAMGAGQPD